MADRRLYAILTRYFSRKYLMEAKKQKGRTKKKRGGPWKLSQLRKSIKVAVGDIFLMIFTVAWKTLLGLPQLPPARRRLHQQPN